jgi:hypothetical protein
MNNNKQKKVGNWTANITADLMVTFDQLTTVEQDGYCVLSRLYWVYCKTIYA